MKKYYRTGNNSHEPDGVGGKNNPRVPRKPRVGEPFYGDFIEEAAAPLISTIPDNTVQRKLSEISKLQEQKRQRPTAPIHPPIDQRAVLLVNPDGLSTEELTKKIHRHFMTLSPSR